MRARKKEIPKDGGTKVRVLSIPSIRDRVVQGALKLILEPIFEADFQTGVVWIPSKTDSAMRRYNEWHKRLIGEKPVSSILTYGPTSIMCSINLLLEKVARRVQDDEVMRLLKMILKATGKKGVPPRWSSFAVAQ